jgi:hypothetical protein
MGPLGKLLAIRSTLGGSEALPNLQSMSSADFVDVQDNHATGGIPIALGPDRAHRLEEQP